MRRSLFLFLGALLLVGAAEPPSKPVLLSPEEAAKQGRALAADILSQLSQKPAQNATNTGTLKIRDAKGKHTEFPVRFEIFTTSTNWQTLYRADRTNGNTNSNQTVSLETIRVIHGDGLPNRYDVIHDFRGVQRYVVNGKVLAEEIDSNGRSSTTLSGDETMIPFAGSDFWVADLNLEFFHWPEQHLLKKEIRRGQSCSVLESINPRPEPGSYLRVVSWIDIDSDGIIHAEAYDFQNKLLKQFDPKELKKVKGQWQLEEMEIDNRQTGSRTRIEFDLDQK